MSVVTPVASMVAVSDRVIVTDTPVTDTPAVAPESVVMVVAATTTRVADMDIPPPENSTVVLLMVKAALAMTVSFFELYLITLINASSLLFVSLSACYLFRKWERRKFFAEFISRSSWVVGNGISASFYHTWFSSVQDSAFQLFPHWCSRELKCIFSLKQPFENIEASSSSGTAFSITKQHENIWLSVFFAWIFKACLRL